MLYHCLQRHYGIHLGLLLRPYAVDLPVAQEDLGGLHRSLLLDPYLRLPGT